LIELTMPGVAGHFFANFSVSAPTHTPIAQPLSWPDCELETGYHS
jgi:hypothetical protein